MVRGRGFEKRQNTKFLRKENSFVFKYSNKYIIQSLMRINGCKDILPYHKCIYRSIELSNDIFQRYISKRTFPLKKKTHKHIRINMM